MRCFDGSSSARAEGRPRDSASCNFEQIRWTAPVIPRYEFTKRLPIYKPYKAPGHVHAVAFVPRDDSVLTSADDGRVYIWRDFKIARRRVRLPRRAPGGGSSSNRHVLPRRALVSPT